LVVPFELLRKSKEFRFLVTLRDVNTTQRAGNQGALRARCDRVNLERGVLTVPFSNSGRLQRVPLPPAGVLVPEG
jgi:hypothetical protein